MEWSSDSIPVAIIAAKNAKSIFAVYIAGTDDSSGAMTEVWNSSNVVQLCTENKIVALKLEANSPTCVQFSQIYPVVCVPCTYFIGFNGVPLECVGGNVSKDEFLDKINKAIKMLNETPSPASPSQATPTAKQETPQTSQQTVVTPSNATPAAEAPPTDMNTPSGATPTVESPVANSSTTADTAEASSAPVLDQKIEIAKELMAQKRAEKAQKEFEKSKEEEINRRNMAKDQSKLRAWQEERNAKETVDQMKKDRELDKIAKQRVREQIALDRAERAARFQNHKSDESEGKRVKLQAKQELSDQAEANTASMKKDSARIQFRLPDGSSVTETFPSNLTFEAAYSFIAQHERNQWHNFSLSTRYPKHVFTQDDMNTTLLDLQLAPSAIIIVLPPSKANPVLARTNDGGGLFSMLWFLLTPFLSLWSVITSLFRGTSSGSQSNSATNQQSARPPYSSPATSKSEGKSPRPESSQGVRKREGNLWRLNRDDDDENATWNGNSTQQM